MKILTIDFGKYFFFDVIIRFLLQMRIVLKVLNRGTCIAIRIIVNRAYRFSSNAGGGHQYPNLFKNKS
jgi:hypothetical protein